EVLVNRVIRRALVALISLVTAIGVVLSVGAGAAAAAEEEPPDRSTPRRAVAAFMEAAAARDFGRAAELMDLHAVPYGARKTRGPELAEQLHYVLDRTLWLEPEQISNEPEGRPEDGADIER